MDITIKKLEQKKTVNGIKPVWKTVKIAASSSPEKEISILKESRATFKVLENAVEKTYNFNGNNYVISLKRA